MNHFVFDTNQIGPNGLNLLESQQWGDLVDPREYLWDTPDFFGVNQNGINQSRIEDRLHGDYWPIYRTETDLAQVRGIAQMLMSFEPRAVGVIELLGNYIIGTGFKFTARADSDDTPPKAVELVQKFVDTFLDQNDFQNDLDKEIHSRSREHGEAPIALDTSTDAIPMIRTLEADQVTEPAKGFELEEYVERTYGVDCSNPTSWKYGVHTPENRTDQVLGYHVIHGGAGSDWDYYPADRFELFKRNVPRNAKRGVSDFHWVWSEMGNEAKLRRNTVTGAQIQAAIAYIRQHVAGTTQGTAQGMVTGGATGTRQVPAYGGGNRTIAKKRHDPGTVVDIPAGMNYLPGPMGAERNSSLLLPGEYILRCIGSRWQTPEYMISNDASNGNYASTLVAESPFVKAREADQEWYGKRFKSLIWKAMKMAYQVGYFDSLGLDWNVLMMLVDIKCDPPEVSSRDPLAIAQRQQIEIQNGTLSKETAIAESGRDPEEELPKIQAERPAAPPSALQGALQGAMESVETADEAKEIFRHISEVMYP